LLCFCIIYLRGVHFWFYDPSGGGGFRG